MPQAKSSVTSTFVLVRAMLGDVSAERPSYELLAEERWYCPPVRERFDRMGFARRALAVLGPAKLTALFYPTGHRLRVLKGRDLARGWDARWAFIGIPPTASREQIVLSLVELLGEPTSPWLIELVVAAARQDPV
jgi:hypothetical protein